MQAIKGNIPTKIFNAFLGVFFVIMIFVTLYPFWNLGVISFNDPLDSIKGNLYFIPRKFTLVSYQTIFESANLLLATFNSVLRTVVGTLANVFCSTLIAYALSRKDFVLRKFMNKFVIFTMYITAGLIPTFILYRDIHLLNNFFVYLLPHLLSAYNIIIIRTYMQDIPASLTEAATIDGASDAKILIKIIFPLSLPVIATVTLFIAVWQWSQWQDTSFFASSNDNLTTLQYEMKKILTSVNTLTDSQLQGLVSQGGVKATSESLQAAMTLIATFPILFIYPFLQKYFVNGVTIGAVKE